MKKVTLGFSILVSAAIFVVGCKKDKNVAPEPDTEVQSAIYASWANYVVSDIEMACSFMAENNYNYTFYSTYPGSNSGNTGTVNVIRDTTSCPSCNPPLNEDQLVMAWNTTRCMDGNLRDGSIFMNVEQNNNQRYSREAKFAGRIRFAGYKINGWLVELWDPARPMWLRNSLTTNSYSPTSTKLKWTVEGKIKLTHPTDPANKSMVWEGTLVKTLDNTSDPKVFPVSKQGAITWSLAVIKYHGNTFGTVPQIDTAGKITPNVAFKMNINENTPLVRDFQCSPDKVTSVVLTPTPGTLGIRGSEHHPFKMGVASFTVGDSYPRQIYYGNEGEPQLGPQCDNTGEVLIKGVSYRINFMR